MLKTLNDWLIDYKYTVCMHVGISKEDISQMANIL